MYLKTSFRKIVSEFDKIVWKSVKYVLYYVLWTTMNSFTKNRQI